MARWAGWVYLHRKLVLLVSVLVWLVAGGVVLHGTTLSNSNTFSFESGTAGSLAASQLNTSAAGITLPLIYTSPTESALSPAFEQQVAEATHPLRSDNRVASVTLPFTQPPAQQQALISSDQHSVIVTVALATTNINTAISQAQSIFNEAASSNSLRVTTYGQLAVEAGINHYVATDLVVGSAVSLPAALLLLLLIFGTVAAALTCLVTGVVAVTAGIALMALLNVFTPVSSYAPDVVGLIGLGVGVDYSLFITSRFREELGRGSDTKTALQRAYATAGRAITFSGFIVAIGLSGMLFFQGTFLVSMGLAGALVVIATVLTAMTLLCALLAILGPRVNRLRVPLISGDHHPDRGFWRRLATFVMRRPVWVLVPALLILVLLGSPFPSIKLVNSDYTTLPPSSPARQGSELLAAQFPQQHATQIDVVMKFDSGGPFADRNIAAACELARRIQTLPNVLAINSYVSLSPSIPCSEYPHIYAQGVAAGLQQAGVPQLQGMVSSTTGGSIALLQVNSHLDQQSNAATTLVTQIRARDQLPGETTYVGGVTAFNIDFVQFMESHTPWAALFVMLITFAALLLLLRSVVLPIKAVIMNLLSMSAAFGAMVWIFQQGHLGGLLGVTPAPIDATLPPLLFCIVFGLSMDYEVFLLTRMQERWIETHDNRQAVADGLQASGRLVTGAAAIMVAVFTAFAFGHVTVIKAIGLGMAVAVFTDATVVRALVVPALMRLLGTVNWWAPRWLRGRPPMAEGDRRVA